VRAIDTVKEQAEYGRIALCRTEGVAGVWSVQGAAFAQLWELWICEKHASMSVYHTELVERAEAAVASGSVIVALAAMQKDAALWALPALLAVLICTAFGLSGTASLWVSLPLVGVSIAGGVIYIGAIYASAWSRRANDS
jgi:hypothetical protein